MFDKKGLYSMRDDYTARMMDAMFRHVWRYREADFYIAQLASRRPLALDSPSGEDLPLGESPLAAAALSAPLSSMWVYEDTHPEVVHPVETSLAAVRGAISALEKRANPAAAARRVTTQALVALHKHLSTTLYTGSQHDSTQRASPNVTTGASENPNAVHGPLLIPGGSAAPTTPEGPRAGTSQTTPAGSVLSSHPPPSGTAPPPTPGVDASAERGR